SAPIRPAGANKNPRTAARGSGVGSDWLAGIDLGAAEVNAPNAAPGPADLARHESRFGHGASLPRRWRIPEFRGHGITWPAGLPARVEVAAHPDSDRAIEGKHGQAAVVV